MNREQLAHVLRAAATIVSDGKILVVGSQSILGTADAPQLPLETTLSIEADIAFFDDHDEQSQTRSMGPSARARSSMPSSATTPKVCPSRLLSCRRGGETA